MENVNVYKERAKAYFHSRTAVHIITKADSFTDVENWVNGFIVEKPEEFFFKVWDKVDGFVKVHYIDITKFVEYLGEIDKLPVPDGWGVET